MTIYDLLALDIENIRTILENNRQILECKREGGDLIVLPHCTSVYPHKDKLKSVLLEAINVLEESKKAFKSKQLEVLRKKMIEVLADIA